MISNTVPRYVTSIVPCDTVHKRPEKNNSVYIYHTFQSIFGRICVHCNKMRKQQTLRREQNSGTVGNNDSTSQKSLLSKPEDISFECVDNEKDQMLYSEDGTSSLCQSSIHDISSNDSMVLNSNDFDFLMKCSNSNRNLCNIDKCKENFYVKFDPLYTKSNTSIKEENVMFINSTEFDIGYETGSTGSASDLSLTTVNSPGIVLNTFKKKPTQVVSPVMNGNSIPTCIHNQAPILVRSASAFISPRLVTVASLINIEKINPPQTTQKSIENQQHMNYNKCSIDIYQLQTTKNILQKQECELHQLRKENKHLKSMLQSLEKKKKLLYEDLASNLEIVSDENKKLLQRQNQLLQQVKEKAYDNKQISLVMEKYENTISVLINEQQKTINDMHERETKLRSERDQALNHLLNMEASFNDLLAKYEKSKSTIQELKEKEKLYRDKTTKHELVIKQYQNMYLNLKQITHDALHSANDTWANTMKNHTAEVTKLKATIKKHDITIASLQESILQKAHNNEKLTAICEDLINKLQ